MWRLARHPPCKEQQQRGILSPSSPCCAPAAPFVPRGCEENPEEPPGEAPKCARYPHLHPCTQDLQGLVSRGVRVLCTQGVTSGKGHTQLTLIHPAGPQPPSHPVFRVPGSTLSPVRPAGAGVGLKLARAGVHAPWQGVENEQTAKNTLNHLGAEETGCFEQESRGALHEACF